MWLVFLYLVVSAISAIAAVSWKYGFSLAGTAVLAVIAGGGLKGSIYAWRALPSEYPLKQKALGIVLAAVCLGLALWIGTGVSFGLFGYRMNGLAWSMIGFVLSLIFVPGRWGLQRD